MILWYFNQTAYIWEMSFSFFYSLEHSERNNWYLTLSLIEFMLTYKTHSAWDNKTKVMNIFGKKYCVYNFIG